MYNFILIVKTWRKEKGTSLFLSVLLLGEEAVKERGILLSFSHHWWVVAPPGGVPPEGDEPTGHEDESQ